MKKILLISLLAFIAFPIIAHAYQGQYYWDPIYVERVQTPTDQLNQQLQADRLQRQQNSDKAANLSRTFGNANYLSCYNQICAGKDLSDPRVEASCLSSVEICLIGLKSQTSSCPEHASFSGGSCACNSGYFSRGGKCLTGTEICVLDGGAHRVYNGTVDNSTSILGCDCEVGYEWKDGRCAIKTTKTNDQICQDSFGLNVTFLEIDNSDGRIVCGCKDGYQWNQGRTQCILVIDNVVPHSAVIKNSIQSEVKSIENNSATVVSVAKVNTNNANQLVESKNPIVQSEVMEDKKPKQSVFKDIIEQGLLPWLFNNVRQWFRK